MIGDRRCPISLRKLRVAPRGNKFVVFNCISITWNGLIFQFCYCPPLEQDVTPHFKPYNPPLPKDTAKFA